MVPSSRALAAAMTTEITADLGPILELGAGTGVFTQALIERGIPQDQLILVERHAVLAEILRRRFPGAQVLLRDAAQPLEPELAIDRPVGAVLSGLPVLSMPTRQVIRILDGAFGHLRPSGALYQFTYGIRCPVPRVLLDRLGLRSVKIGNAFANLPPATVYRVTRRAPRPAHSPVPRSDSRQDLGGMEGSAA